MSDVRTGFARSDDGMQLYWRSVGSGPPMLCCNGVGVSTFFWKYIVDHFRADHQIVVWDYRGHGISTTPHDVPHADLSIERTAQDLAAVADAAGLSEPMVLLGHSMGCQVILEFEMRHPERVAALVPLFGTFARPLDSFMDSPASRRVFDVINQLASLAGRRGRRLIRPLYASPLAFRLGATTGLFDRHYASRHDIEAYLEHLVQLDPAVFLRMVELMADHDLTEHLRDVRAPTLVIAGERDVFTPLHRSQEMAARIPGAELLVLAEASHAAIVEHPETINRRIDRFLASRVYGSAASAALGG